MVEVHADRHFGGLRGFHHHGSDLFEGRNLLVELRMGDDDRHIQLFRCSQHRIHTLKVRGVEGADRAFFLFRKFQYFNQIDKHFSSPHMSGRTAS